MIIKMFSEKISPEIYDESAKKEAFAMWKEAFVHENFVRNEEDLRKQMEQREAEDRRAREQIALESELHKKTRSDMIIKMFSEKVSPALYNSAAMKECFGVWKEEYLHLAYMEEEGERVREREKAEKERLELHTKTRSDMMLKYFSSNVSPGIHDKAAKQEAFGVWKEDFMTLCYAKREREMKRITEEAAERKAEEERKERNLHLKTRSDMIVKLFAEKVNPGLHDSAAKKEGYGVWKEMWMHHRFRVQEEKLKAEMKRKEQEEEKRKEHEQKAIELHQVARSEMIMKFMSEKFAPGIHDVAAKTEAFDVWKQDFVTSLNQLEAERRFAEHQYVSRVHAKTRSDMILKYFSERVGPGVHDVACKKEGFGGWKEEWLEVVNERREEVFREEMRLQEEAQARKRAEEAKERELHMKTRSDMIVKMFSEKISPGVHDIAAKREAFGSWKEGYVHEIFMKREELLNANRDEQARVRAEENAREREVHTKTRSDMMMKYFSDKVAPGVHDDAMVKEGFGSWKEEFLQHLRVRQEEIFEERIKLEQEAQKRQRAEEAKQHALHQKTRSDMVIKLFSEKINPNLHGLAAKKEAFGVWKEDFVHDEFLKRETTLKSKLELEARRRAEEHAKEREVHNKARGDMIVKLFSEKISPKVHGLAARKESFAAWHEQFMHSTFIKRENEMRKSALEAAQRVEREYAREREERTKARSDMVIKLFSEKISPQIYAVAAAKESFSIWKEQSMHWRFQKREENLISQMKAKEEAETRNRIEAAREREVHTKTRSDMILKYFSSKVSPNINEKAAKKEVLGAWQEQYMAWSFQTREEKLKLEMSMREAEVQRRRAEEQTREREVHAKTRSDMVMRLFSDKISPSVNEAAFKKEGFGIWKESAMRWRFENQEELFRRKLDHNREEESRKQAELAAERALHNKARGDMIVKLFSEKISPNVHDLGAKKEGFGLWKEQYMHCSFEKQEREYHAEARMREAQENERREEQQRKEKELHTKTRSEMMIKYFAGSHAPNMHDTAAKTEAFGVWKEEFLHTSYVRKERELQLQAKRQHEAEERRRAAEYEAERKLHRKTRSDVILKYFSEKVSPQIHDGAMKKEGFGVWKEQFIHWRFKRQEEKITEDARLRESLEAKRYEELAKEHALHTQSRTEMVIKLFSEKISPGIHDQGAKKEYFDVWKEDYIRDMYMKREGALLQEIEAEDARQRDAHTKARSEMILKLFSEKLSPGLHDSAAKKEAFENWRDFFIHGMYADRERTLIQNMKEQREHDARRNAEMEREHALHNEARNDMIIKLFSEKISPKTHDLAGKKEAFQNWKEECVKWYYARREERIREKLTKKKDKEALKRERRIAKERQLHSKSRSDMIVKYFSEKINPGIHDLGMKKEAFGDWKEAMVHDRAYTREIKLRNRMQKAEIQRNKAHKSERSNMITKYFSEKVCVAVHDRAARSEAFQVLKEEYFNRQWKHHSDDLRIEIIQNSEKAKREVEEQALEHAVHLKSRSSMLVKYFSDTICPRVHDLAAKKHGFGEWKESFYHSEFVQREKNIKNENKQRAAQERQNLEAEREQRRLHIKSRSDLMVRYFSETVCPRVHDLAAVKVAFEELKREYLETHHLTKQEILRREMEAADVERLKNHTEARSELILKFFSETVSPAIHDLAAKKNAVSAWKEQWQLKRFKSKKWAWKSEMASAKEAVEAHHQEVQKARKLHDKTRSDMIVNCFSDKICPRIHDVAMKKEGFGVWKEDFLHMNFVQKAKDIEKRHDKRVELRELEHEEEIKGKILHTKAERAKVISYFTENVMQKHIHDDAVKSEAMTGWKELIIHSKYRKREDKIREEMNNTHKSFRKTHNKMRSGMVMKYFSEKVAPAVHDMSAKKEGFGCMRENWLAAKFSEKEEVIKKEERKKFEVEVRNHC